MKIKLLTPIVFLSACLLMGVAASQAEDQKSSSAPGCMPGGQCQPPSGHKEEHREHFKKKMLERFDTNKDGKLDDSEKAAMKAEMEKHKGQGGHHHGPHHEQAGQGNPPAQQ